jgi:hypothetical protein
MFIEPEAMSGNAALHRKQAARASSWLASLSLPPDATEAHVQRLFGVCAGQTLIGKTHPAAGRRQLQKLVVQLRQFVWFRYSGDPIFALATRRMLRDMGLFHESLDEYYLGCKSLPIPQGSTSDASNRLFFDLSDRSSAHLAPVNLPIPPIGSLVRNGRSALLDLCRTIMTASSCGAHQLGVIAGLQAVLPKLCCSYATDWDLAATCILARTCAYLGLSRAPPCRAAQLWLLDQQRSDGRFGLLLPKDRKEKQDPAGGDDDFLSTVDVLWALAEMHRPGFMLGEQSRSDLFPAASCVEIDVFRDDAFVLHSGRSGRRSRRPSWSQSRTLVR